MKRRFTVTVHDNESGKKSTTEADVALVFAAERSIVDVLKEARDKGEHRAMPGVEMNMYNLSSADVRLMLDLFNQRIIELSETMPEFKLPLEGMLQEILGEETRARVEHVSVEEHDLDESEANRELVSRLMRH